jgi:DNA-binding MarR family transcriptional regulator
MAQPAARDRHGAFAAGAGHAARVVARFHALYKKPRLTMAEIAAKIGRDKSTVTALVDKLVRLGYVTKEKDTEDSRVVYVTLTHKGDELKPVFDAISKEVLDVLYLGISEKEKEDLIRILNKILYNF